MGRTWVFFHILGAVIFLGNMVVTFFWKLMADFSKDQAILVFSQRMVMKTDLFFTILGAGLITATGYIYASKIHLSIFEPWLLWAQVSFYASAVIWLLALVPIQYKQSVLTDQFKRGELIPERYWYLSRYWNRIGLVATLLPVLSLFLMVVKPSF